MVLKSSYMRLDEGSTLVLKVGFRLRERTYDAYAYARPGHSCGAGKTATLIIPGSGSNQSSAIFHGERENYHFGILEALEEAGGAAFVLVKPNEDFLAFHDGNRKLDGAFFINYQLNRQGSYSASYIVQALAIAKFLRSCFGTLIVAGLSQGGGAALLTALQVKPHAAIIASGYSTLVKDLSWSGFEQIVLPTGTYWEVHDAETLAGRLESSPTRFLFTWGREDTPFYRVEVARNLSCHALSRLPNVHCAIHDSGHVFPVTEIRRFLRAQLAND